MSIDQDKLKKLAEMGDDVPIPFPTAPLHKGVLSGAFADNRKRRNKLVARLKRRRRYGNPVRGGTGKQARTRRRKF